MNSKIMFTNKANTVDPEQYKFELGGSTFFFFQ